MTEMYQEHGSTATMRTPYYGLSDAECIQKEDAAVATVRKFARENKEYLWILWNWGDGGGGGLLDLLAAETGLMTASQQTRARPKPSYVKTAIPANLRTQVFERDMYRCMQCGTHKNLTCDHIHPESKGGATTLDNLQTLCKSCNSKKGVKA